MIHALVSHTKKVLNHAVFLFSKTERYSRPKVRGHEKQLF